MIKNPSALLTAALLGLALVLGAGSTHAGGGMGCDGKKKDGDTALILTPEMQLVHSH